MRQQATTRNRRPANLGTPVDIQDLAWSGTRVSSSQFIIQWDQEQPGLVITGPPPIKINGVLFPWTIETATTLSMVLHSDDPIPDSAEYSLAP